MKKFCPYCNMETNLDVIKETEKFVIKGKEIEIDVEYFKCKECNEEFEDQFSDIDPLKEAYKKYRNMTNMIQPDQIRSFREKYGLSQRELSDILGWGGATISRYENGALQDETHDNVLRLIMNPINLSDLIQKNPGALTERKRKLIMRQLRSTQEVTSNIELIFDKLLGNYDPDFYSGFKRLDITKLLNLIIFFCIDGVFKTKLNKLLFYSEFKHFKEYGISITGAKYAHIPHGPSLDDYDYYFAFLKHTDKSIVSKEVYFDNDVYGEEFISVSKPDLSIFKPSEIEILEFIKEHFKNYTSKQIRDFSHNEAAFVNTSDGEIISYEFADKLQV